MIVRVQKRENPYVVIDKTIVNDKSLSFKARGIACYLLGKPDDWSISERHLVTCGPDGAAAIRSGLKELESAGYLRRERKRADDGTFVWEATLYETPQPCCDFPRMDNPSTDNPRMDNPGAGNQSILSNVLPSNEKPSNEKPSNEDQNNHAPPEPKPPAPATPTPVSSSFSYDCSEMFRFHDTNFGTLTQYSRDMLLDYVETYGGPDIVIDAMRVAVQANKKSLRYTEGVLKNWHADGRDDKKTKASSPTKSNNTAGSYVPVDVMAELERITLEQQRIGSH